MPRPTQRERNETAVIHEIANRLDRVSTYPFEIQFSGEHRCNLRCIQCGATIERNQGMVPLMDERLPRRSLERFEKLRPQIPSWQWLSLTGSGETLINPDLPRILDILVETDHDCAVAFNTNGTLWTREKAKMIVETGVDEIRFSMDGATKETFERIRVNAKFDKVVEGIRTLRSVRDELGASNPKIAFSCNFMRQNIEEFPGLIELAAELGAVQVFANNTIIYAADMQDQALSGYRPLVRRMLREAEARAAELGIGLTNYLLTDPGGDDEESEACGVEEEPGVRKAEVATPTISHPLAPVAIAVDAPEIQLETEPELETQPEAVVAQSPEETSPATEGCEVTGKSGRSDDTASLAESILQPLEGLPADLPSIVHACQRPWTGLYVENNGYVKVCCFDVQPIGNLDEQSFDEIWNGPLARELRSSFLEDRPPEGCRNCFIFAAARASEDVFIRPSGSTRSHIDVPGLDPRVHGTTIVHGWALDRAGVDRVELFVDGELQGVTLYGQDRPDVEIAFPGYPDGSSCGFRFDLDTSKLSVGEHLLAVFVHSLAGDVSDGPQRAILVAR